MNSMNSNKKFKIFCILLSGVLAVLTTAGAKPTINFTLPPSFRALPSSFSRAAKDVMKEYSGLREKDDTLLMIYYHDLAIAVVELGAKKLLVSCEIIEVYHDDEGKKLLKQLSSINRPLKIGFNEMVKLMSQCEIVDSLKSLSSKKKESSKPNVNREIKEQSGIFGNNPFSLLSGIIPGTKWCGTGDIAKNYHDLGTEPSVDRCCRTHDLCPVKVRSYQNRYNLINNSLYTKSHCTCDDMLYDCLKQANSTSAQLMGTIYFNLVQVPCVTENSKGESIFRNAKTGF